MSDDALDIAVRLRVLEHRANESDRALAAIQRSTAEISASLSALVRLEEQHAETRRSLERAFSALQEQSKRIDTIEDQMPTLRLVQRWVLGAIAGLLSAAGLAVWALISNKG